jgi:hypothetical protein
MKFEKRIKMNGSNDTVVELELTIDQAKAMSEHFFNSYPEGLCFEQRSMVNGGWVFTVKDRKKQNIFSLKTIL